MKQPILLFLFFVIASSVFAQKIDVDKSTGLVKVDDKDAFYLIKKNKDFLGNYDLSVQNIAGKELAYLKMAKVENLPWDERNGRTGLYYIFTFSETANSANYFPDAFSGLKATAKEIVNSKLIVDDAIDSKAEKMFIVSHKGKFASNIDGDTKPITVIVNGTTNDAKAKLPTSISIKGNSIYNNDELIGTFKKSTEDKVIVVGVYNKDDIKIATALHNDADENADWDIRITSSGKSTQLLYNSSTPLEKLFKFLVDKGYL